jgi:hypothetical protein
MTDKYKSDYVEYIPKKVIYIPSKNAHNYKRFNEALLRIGDNNCENWKRTMYSKTVLNKKDDQCLCGKDILNHFYIKHESYGTCRVGSTCIKEFMGQDILKEDCLKCGQKVKRKHKTINCKNCRVVAKVINKNKKKLFIDMMKKQKFIQNKIEQKKIDQKISQKIKDNICIKCDKQMKNIKYKVCYTCKFKCCKTCKKRNIKRISYYENCFNCNKKVGFKKTFRPYSFR